MNRLIVDHEEFKRVWSTVALTMDQTALLPSRVFRNENMYFRFAEFDYLLSEEGWTDCVSLLNVACCGEMFVGSLDPNPIDYYVRHFGHPGWWVVDDVATGSDYLRLLAADPGNSGADALRYNAEILCFVASNQQFSIYANRSFECAILAVSNAAHLEVIGDKWLSCDTFVANGLLSTGRPAEAFIATLVKNFS